jgi:hypothetical protein
VHIVIISYPTCQQVRPTDPLGSCVGPLARQFTDQCLTSLPILSHKLAIGTNKHALLASRQHDIRPPLVREEANPVCSDHAHEDVIVFVTLYNTSVRW